MADYSLVVNSRFQPFSFERYLQPYQIYGQEYKAQEAALEEIANNSGKWENLINEQTDPDLYNQVVNYNKELDSLASGLVSSGLSPKSRQSLLKMKSRYNKEFTPIEQAYNKREELAKQQLEDYRRDKTTIVDKDYSTMSLKEIMDNPSATYKSLSGADIANRTAKAVKEAAKNIVGDPELSYILGGQYIQQKISQGYTPEQALLAAQRDPKAPKELLNIIDTIKGEVGYNNWNNENKNKIDYYINEGLNSAIAESAQHIIVNNKYMTEQEKERQDLEMEILRHNKDKEKGITLPNGNKLIVLGAGQYVQYDKDGNIVKPGDPNYIQVKDNDTPTNDLTDKLKAIGSNKAEKDLKLRELGYRPTIAVVHERSSGYSTRKEGEDVDNRWLWPNVGVANNWGNVDYSAVFERSNDFGVVSPNNIPGFTEFKANDPSWKNKDWGKVLDAAYEAGLIKKDDEGNLIVKGSKFNTDDVQIMRVRSPRGGDRKSSRYDYILYVKQ